MSEEMSPSRTRVLIVDDHPAVRESLASWIGRQPDLEVCGEAIDTCDALQLVNTTRPELAVIDISLKSGNGLDLIKRIMDRTDSVRILVWSTHSESLYAERCLRAGALGYIQKDQAMDKLMEAIRRVLSGKVYLSSNLTERLLQRNVGDHRKNPTESVLDTLADREIEVLRLIGEGRKHPISRNNSISAFTRSKHTERGSSLNYFWRAEPNWFASRPNGPWKIPSTLCPTNTLR